MLKLNFKLNWIFEAQDAIMTCSILNCTDKSFLIFGGHDKSLYLMDNDLMVLDDVSFDGWCRCTYPIDLDGDGCDDVLVGTGDGRFIVLKFDKKKKKFIGRMNFKSWGMINCCVAGDLYGDGSLELMFGGEDKTFKVFKSMDSTEPLMTFYYDSWVMACDFGYIKPPKFDRPIAALLIGTKNGLLQLIRIKDNKPDILWQKNVYAQINDIKIADVNQDGFNEIVVASDDPFIKIYDNMGKRLNFINIDEIEISSKKKGPKKLNRPKKLLIDDIDGDKAKEIVVGCADGTLRAFQKIQSNSNKFELKWRTKPKHSASIKSICSLMNEEMSIKNIIYSGNERAIRNISDFEWGKKPVIKIPQRFKIPKISFKTPAKGTEDKSEIKVVPTNLRGFIKKLLDAHGFYITLDLLISDLMDKGYNRKEIKEELEFLKEKGAMRYDKTDVSVWSLVSDDLDELIKAEASKSKKSPGKKK